MKIFQPPVEEQEDGFVTSFTFDSSEEQQSFADFLNNMSIGFLKSKFPVVEDGKVRYQTGFVVASPTQDTVEDQEPEQVEEVVEEKPKRKGKKAELA